jgi:hypothetical protein
MMRLISLATACTAASDHRLVFAGIVIVRADALHGVAERQFPTSTRTPERVINLRALRRRSCTTHDLAPFGVFASNSALRSLNELNGPPPTAAANTQDCWRGAAARPMISRGVVVIDLLAGWRRLELGDAFLGQPLARHWCPCWSHQNRRVLVEKQGPFWLENDYVKR